MAGKYVYFFGGSASEGNMTMKGLLGGKGANLAEMAALGVPVPPGFTVTTEACELYQKEGSMPDGVMSQVKEKLEQLEKTSGKSFSEEDPLLVSVRSGAAVSMPGMMDTVLNLGLNDSTVERLAKASDERSAFDAYRRFLQMFGDVVLDVDHSLFEDALDSAKETKGVAYDHELGASELKNLVASFKSIIEKETGKPFPEDPIEQLRMAISAVFDSWNNARAKSYRRINKITGLKGTAVNVQAMVFGNRGDDSGTGVCFTRSPSDGDDNFYGEYLINAQGEDVVAGTRTPEDISGLKQKMPAIYDELFSTCKRLESHYKDMQDIEFTIEHGKLFILQTRAGKRTAASSLKIALDMVDEGLLTKEEAVLRVDPAQLDHLLHKQFDAIALSKAEIIGMGLPASPGAAVGRIVFDAETAVSKNKEGESVILVRSETSPEDISGMDASAGILTARGGMTSHAAVVARGMGKCCIAGCSDAQIDGHAKTLSFGDIILKEGDDISLDGSSGKIYKGQVPSVMPELTGDFRKLMDWADEFRTMGVRTNADTPYDSKKAVDFGAEGIGLCRTEHMFFEGKRILAMREMILADDEKGRETALAKLLPYQRDDFVGIFLAMGKRPVTIRLLDPPLHEFLPNTDDEIKELSGKMGVDEKKIRTKLESLREFNPMLGHRGCRLGISFPEITRMQARAIFEAAIAATEKLGTPVAPEVMVPLVGNQEEFRHQREIIDEIAKKVFEERGKEVPYMVGTMIEVPRAALTADEIAKYADFFSFGTNDLTQMTLGFSRDDVGSFVPHYIEKGILPEDPFASLDKTGVGQLVELAVKKGRKVKEKLKIGICGEHGGDPASITFCYGTGIDYVSCSPYRVPIARLAAAQASIRGRK